jgi:hypothetical protein
MSGGEYGKFFFLTRLPGPFIPGGWCGVVFVELDDRFQLPLLVGFNIELQQGSRVVEERFRGWKGLDCDQILGRHKQLYAE